MNVCIDAGRRDGTGALSKETLHVVPHKWNGFGVLGCVSTNVY